VPTDIRPRVLTTAIDLDDSTASLKLALQVASYFELGEGAAREIVGQVGQTVAAWRREAKKLGLTAAEIDRMALAFEHEDLKAALAVKARRKMAKSHREPVPAPPMKCPEAVSTSAADGVWS
jgi:serine/threonine-protein kinase HipA